MPMILFFGDLVFIWVNTKIVGDKLNCHRKINLAHIRNLTVIK